MTACMLAVGLIAVIAGGDGTYNQAAGACLTLFIALFIAGSTVGASSSSSSSSPRTRPPSSPAHSPLSSFHTLHPFESVVQAR